MKQTDIAIIVLIVLSFLSGILLYGHMPDQMASHWNSAGEVDGWMSKFWGVFLMPILGLALFLLFLAVPRIDPLRRNVEKFRKHFDWFVLLIIAFLMYIHVLSLTWNLGHRFDMGRMIIPALGLLFIFVGILVSHAKRNWFIGIRTPWTLSSDRVWDKTHAIGGKMFKAAGVVALLGAVFPRHAMWLVLVPVVFVALFTLVYSYVEFQKEEKGKHEKKPVARKKK